MNEYLIKHKIKTPSHLFNSFSFEGFTFTSWSFSIQEGPARDAWLASKVVCADNALQAINLFRKELQPLVDIFSVSSQCYFDFIMQPFIITKINNNPEKISFFRYSVERDVVGLSFDGAEINSSKQLLSFNSDGIEYLHEANNASSYLSRLIFLLLSLEAFSGQSTTNNGKITTDKDKIKEILGDDSLYKDIYQYGDGIRNKLLHGSSIRLFKGDINHVEVIYGKIVGYLESQGVVLDKRVKDPGRTFEGNYEQSSFWVKPNIVADDISLKDLLDGYSRLYENRRSGHHDNYEEVHPLFNIDSY